MALVMCVYTINSSLTAISKLLGIYLILQHVEQKISMSGTFHLLNIPICCRREVMIDYTTM